MTRPEGRAVARGSRRASLVLGTWASIVFVALWAGAVIGAMGDGSQFADAWAWIGSLGTVGAVVVWILFLPVCIGLWATQAGLSLPVMVVVMALLAVWTAAAWVGLARTLAGGRMG